MISKSLIPTSFALLIAIALFTVPTGCKPKRTQEEQLTLGRVRTMVPWLEDFKVANSRFPNDWDELLKWKGASMQVNPYSNLPMVQLGSRDFDPKISPGNFFYARVIQDEEVINYTIIVFGARGEIRRIGHTAMGAK